MKKSKYKFRVQYRQHGCWSNGFWKNGCWVNGSSYDSKEEAERYAKASGRDYQIIKDKA